MFQPNIIHEISGNISASGFQYVKNSYIAIINSMTIDVNIQTSGKYISEDGHVSNGSGVQVQDVNKLLKQFVEMQKMMKMFSKG